MNKNTFINALDGERNKEVKQALQKLIKLSSSIEIVNGKIEMIVTNLSDNDKGLAYAVANFNNFEHCNAMITYDLGTFICHDLSELITDLRIN